MRQLGLFDDGYLIFELPKAPEPCDSCKMSVQLAAHRRRVVYSPPGETIVLRLCVGCATLWLRTEEGNRPIKFAGAIGRAQARAKGLVEKWTE